MESQKLESIVIDLQRLQQLQDDKSQKLKSIIIVSQRLQQLQNNINKEIIELLNSSNVSKRFDKSSISGQKSLKVECSLNLIQF
ncbi:MAG: hypothetical protein V7K32_25635 [Nostoc sp.]|uniref:hypothetical protein n=1 Tax=Nostoc sp. TaxID=1180 RepID=UPI002FFC4B3B